MKILVKSDVFNICNRIKKFDCTYTLVYNNISKKYEVYSTRLTQAVELVGGRVLSYVCTLPYDTLDERSIKYLYDTSVDNIEEIIKQIDASNKKLERENELKLKQCSLEIGESKLRQLT